MINTVLFGKSTSLNGHLAHTGLLVLRLAAGLTMAFAHGKAKIPPPEQFVGFLEVLGMPMPIAMAWMAALAEFCGSLLVALGLLTRPAAFTMVVTMGVAAFVAHGSDPFQKQELPLIYFFIFVFILLAGPGKWSIDNRIAGKR